MMHVKKQQFGILSDGTEVFLFTLDNGNMRVSVTNYGACITSILLPSKNRLGFDDVALGYSTLAGYIDNEPHFGSLIGRFAGRISNAKVCIGQDEYALTKNDGKHCLHGGYPFYDKQVWKATYDKTQDNATVFLERYSQSGEQGFPGNLQLLVSYTLTSDNEIVLRYYAKTDAPTFVNLTNHTYFNLNPSGMQADGNYVSVVNHELLIPADEYLETNAQFIPTGKFLKVENTAYDFRTPRLISDSINATAKKGLDTTFVIKKDLDSYKALACVVHEPVTERMLRVYSTQPGLTVYTGNFLDHHFGKNGNRYNPYAGICLESQNFPDAPNKKMFPHSLLLPEQIYNQETVWYFTF